MNNTKNLREESTTCSTTDELNEWVKSLVKVQMLDAAMSEQLKIKKESTDGRTD
tara:strand:- start:2890 stop:3051 length:162 start_codon:yes stop_codon:yes gene_type:complete